MTWSAPTFGAVATVNATSITANLPASIPVGALLVLAVANRGLGAITQTTPTGYTLFKNFASGGLSLYGKIAGGSESNPSITVSSSDFLIARMAYFTGAPASISGIVDASNVNETGNPGATIPVTPITPANNNDLVLLLYMDKQSWTNSTALSGFTLGSDDKNGTNLSMGLQYQIQTTATTVGSAITINPSGAAISCISIMASLVAGVAAAAPSQGYVSVPGPALSSPSNPNQFQRVLGFGSGLSLPGPLTGISVSHSVAYSAISTLGANLGFIQPPGPHLSSPYTPNQFLQSINDTSQPSQTTQGIFGAAASHSVSYGLVTGGGGNLSGLSASVSTSYGLLTGLTAGQITGLSVSVSTSYGALVGTGGLSGVAQSVSLTLDRSIGGEDFQPLVPMTAVTDVRLNIGYQPWKLTKDKIIG